MYYLSRRVVQYNTLCMMMMRERYDGRKSSKKPMPKASQAPPMHVLYPGEAANKLAVHTVAIRYYQRIYSIICIRNGGDAQRVLQWIDDFSWLVLCLFFRRRCSSYSPAPRRAAAAVTGLFSPPAAAVVIVVVPTGVTGIVRRGWLERHSWASSSQLRGRDIRRRRRCDCSGRQQREYYPAEELRRRRQRRSLQR